MSEPLTPAGLRLAHWLANRGLDDGDIREAIREAEAEARAADAPWWKEQLAAAEAREARLREALMRIRDMDYRGNRSMESDIARAALSPDAET